MSQITFDCGWCSSKSQTAEVIHYSIRDSKTYHGREDQPYIVALCRRCRRASSLYWKFSRQLPAHLTKYKLTYEPYVDIQIFKDSVDATEALTDRTRQYPPAIKNIPAEIPSSVRELCLDAASGRSPRAKCQSLRSAVEFALREASIATKPGQTLGKILDEASKTFAISEPLIELCEEVKAFGNWGLHWPETNITKQDAETAETITYAILEYLFVLPAKVQEAKISTDSAKNKHKNPGAVP